MKYQPSKTSSTQSGSIFTVLLGGLVAASTLSLILYQALSGPVSSMVRITYDTSAKAEAESALNTIAADAVSNFTDCDSDGQIEPRPWRVPLGPAGSFPVTGGLIPDDVGAQLTDRWGTDYGYCVWDVGATRLGPACIGNGTYNTRRLSGSPNITLGIPGSQTVIAIISAGPNRKFETECRAYTLTTNDVIYSAIDGTTAGVGGDDFLIRKTYTQMSQQNPELWALKSLDTTTAVIDKSLEIGTLGAPQVTITPSTGLIATSGRVDATGGLRPGNAIANGACTVGTPGLLRYSTSAAYIEACDGTNFLGPSIDSLTDGKTDYAKFNVFLGKEAGNIVAAGINNTALGYRALYSGDAAGNNTAIGFKALHSNTGADNTAVGSEAAFTNATGDANTAVGARALFLNDSGVRNTAIGAGSLNSLNDGSSNTAVGNGSLFNNQSGSNNTALGTYALQLTVSGSNNTAIGYQAGPETGYNGNDPGDTSNSTAIGAESKVINNYTWVVGKQESKEAIYEGANAAMGITDLNNGPVTVLNSLVTEYSRIKLSVSNTNGSNVGHPYVSARVPGVSFTINSTLNKGNTTTISWEILEPNCVIDLPAPDGNCN